MAAAQILATGGTAADSTDVTLASGSRMTVGLKGAEAGAEVRVYLKDDTNAYNYVGSITPAGGPAEISAPGTYRFSRVAGPVCGVYSG